MGSLRQRSERLHTRVKYIPSCTIKERVLHNVLCFMAAETSLGISEANYRKNDLTGSRKRQLNPRTESRYVDRISRAKKGAMP